MGGKPMRHVTPSCLVEEFWLRDGHQGQKGVRSGAGEGTGRGEEMIFSVRPRLRVSFSGGRTSAFMSIWLKQHLFDRYDMLFVFANTGCEHEDTLRFVDEVDRRFDLGVTWVEAVVHPGRKSCTHRIVDYRTASRHGEPFEAVCAKYGLPNQVFKLCTRELKTNPMASFARSIGWENRSYETAIGIRIDETRRVRPETAKRERIVYPLIDWEPTDKEDVLAFFEDFDWNLKIPEHQGNCITCFKKSDRKLHTLYRENPGNFDFVVKLDDLYRNVGPNNVPGPRRMFRGFRSAHALIAEFQQNNYDASRGVSDGGCSESCELFEIELAT
jgi:3'-phosphoadenosine 5'-phosphosulfate sulfotransferase (PAPS reductase)/FAD synthetase